jgi:hypothetical protein
VQTYVTHYWPDKEAGPHFLHFLDEVEELRQVLQDFFLSVEQQLCFDVTRDEPPLRLNDDDRYNYLNYNTNI